MTASIRGFTSGAEAASAPGMLPAPATAPSGSLEESEIALFLAMAKSERSLLIFVPPHLGHFAFRFDAAAERAKKLKTRLQSSQRNSYTGIDQHSFPSTSSPSQLMV